MKKHIVIIGHGAIGLLWAHHFIKAQHQVTLLSRREQLPPSSQTLICNNGKSTTNQLSFSHNMPTNYDLILVTTKAYQVHNGLSPLLDNITAPIILLHNGMGAVETLSLKASQQVMLATTTHGALLVKEQLTHTGLGKTIIGNYQKISPAQLAQWQHLLQDCLPHVETHNNITQPLLLKLAINCVINPLTAIAQCKNGELTKPEFQTQISAIVDELHPVIFHLDNTWPYTASALTSIIIDVATATAENYSSMAQDVKYKRQTEIDFINGYIVQQGQRLGLAMIENKALLHTIKNTS